MKKAPRTRYYGSKPPTGWSEERSTDGLDGLLINGREVGAARRAQARQHLALLRQREEYIRFLTLEDG